MEFVVRISLFCQSLSVFALGLLVFASPANAIEAKKGKEYKLTERHGPWMIMVASFKTPPPERRAEGKSPKEAADELVYELRKKGIPAYTYTQNEVRDEVETTDRMGRFRKREYNAKQETYCVLAGNYESHDESTKQGRLAKDTLAWIENRFEPEFLTVLDPNLERLLTAPDANYERAVAAKRSNVRKLKSGGILRQTPGKRRQGQGPLAGAFLTLNPLLPEDYQIKKHDPLLRKLNSGQEFSLLDNDGKYTLVVASFYGKSSKAQVGMMGLANFREAQKSFQAGDSLDEAAENAWELATLIRRGYFVVSEVPNPPLDPTRDKDDPKRIVPLKPGQTAFEAYVWHDRFKSVVTVGSFDRLDDARIAQYQLAFGAKFKEHAQTRKPFLAAEQLTIPAVLKGNQLPERAWIFDPKPELVEVPRLH